MIEVDWTGMELGEDRTIRLTLPGNETVLLTASRDGDEHNTWVCITQTVVHRGWP